MKKITISLIGILFSTCILFSTISCKMDKKIIVDELPSNNLNHKLKEFNKNYQFQANNFSFQREKHWWETVGELCAIVTADVAGASTGFSGVQTVATAIGLATEGTGYVVVSLIGGAVGTVGGSYAAFVALNPNKIGSFNNINPEGRSILYELPQEFLYLKKIGLLHNSGLQNIYFADSNPQTELQWIGNNIENLNSIDYLKLYTSTEFQTLITNIKLASKNYINNGYNYNFLLNEYKAKGLMNAQVSLIFSTFFEAINKIQVFEDAVNVNMFYFTAVNNSTLNFKDKETILAGLIVFIQSYYYWYNFQIED